MEARLTAATGTEADGLRSCLGHFATMQSHVDELREGFVVLLALLQHLEFRGEEAAYAQHLKQEVGAQRERLAAVRAACDGQPSPFQSQEQGNTLAEQVMATLPAEDDLPAIMETSQQALENCFALHQRALGQLVILATGGAAQSSSQELSPASAGDAPSRTKRIPTGAVR